MRFFAGFAKTAVRATATAVEKTGPELHHIHIEQLELSSRVGVGAEERAEPQRLVVNLSFRPSGPVVGDDIGATINYALVAQEAQHCAAGRSDKLIETLAEAIASHLLKAFPAMDSVVVELRKFVLSDAAYVAVTVKQDRKTT